MRKQGGFSYVIALLFVALLALLSLRALERVSTNERREKEARLLAVGQAYRQAIATYYENSPGTSKTYPPDLKALLVDERTTTLQRHLRKLFRDPMTKDAEWGLVESPDGMVMGVFSQSERQPIKVAGFPPGLGAFTDAKSYRNWRFVYKPGE